MIVFSRKLSIGAFFLLLLVSSCNLPAVTPTPMASSSPTGETAPTFAATETSSAAAPTALIPVTGSGEVTRQCQFCVNSEPHAVLVIAENAQFYVSEPTSRINCITAQVVNEKRVLLCRGAQETAFNLNVCADEAGCLQYPVTLDPCPLRPQSGNPTPVILAPVNTAASPTLPASTPTQIQLQTAVSPPPVEGTTAPPRPADTQPPAVTITALPPQPTLTPPAVMTATVHAPQSRGTSLPSTRLPRTGLHDPEGFLRWYFEAVWKERNYQDLWDNYLTPGFKSRPNAGGYEGYAAWWSSVARVDVNSVTVLESDGTHAWVRVNVKFTMNDGRIISNQEYDYDLSFDAARRTWMFDYRTP